MTLNSRAKDFSVEAIFPNWHNEEWVSYTLKSVMEGISGEGINIGATVMTKAKSVTAPYVHPVMDRRLLKLINRFIPRPMDFAYRAAKSRLMEGDVAYFWLGSPASMCKELSARNIMVAREMINCTLQLRQEELAKAYALSGIVDVHPISEQDIEEERRDLLATDIIFCPNSFVKSSVIAYGVPEHRCIDTSYGWSQKKMAGDSRIVPDDGVFTAAFVGTVDVRKGAPVLLEAWARANVEGRLLLAGKISAEVRNKYHEILNRPDVISLGHVDDVGSVYRAAHIFCFPTWEEGGPQVTFEAMSAGCVPIVTEMGTGGAFDAADKIGIIVQPGDATDLAHAIRNMKESAEHRIEMSARASTRAKEFVWPSVGLRRRSALIQHRNAWLERTGLVVK